MRRFLPRWWPETCVLAVLLTCGCQHSRPRCATCGGNPVAMGAPIVANETPHVTPALDLPAEAAAPVGNGTPPVVRTTANVPTTDPMLNLTPPPHSSPPGGAVGQLAPISYRAGPLSEHILPNLAGAKFAHDPKYHWLVGTLDYSRIQQAWVLRYVPVEENDRYGGCVTLVPSDRKMNFKHGQTVRVEGALIDPESQQLRPAFQVEDIRAE